MRDAASRAFADAVRHFDADDASAAQFRRRAPRVMRASVASAPQDAARYAAA